jgi:non-heme chloroperoxidase
MSRFQTKDKTEIFFRDIGEGKPVILIHGWPLHGDMWEYQTTPLLRSGFRVITYDRRGFGRSMHTRSGYDYDTLASDLNDLINHLELQKVTLVGFSMGGGEIARYLARFSSERVAKAVLISSVTPFLLQTDSNPDGVSEEMMTQITQGLEKDRPHFLAGFAKDFFGVGMFSSPVSNEILNWSATLAYPASPLATIECVSSFGMTDFRSDMRAFTMPTLIIHGTGDKTVPIAPSGEQAAKLIPHATFKRYEGAPHGLFVTHREQLNEDLLDFLNNETHPTLQIRRDEMPHEASHLI